MKYLGVMTFLWREALRPLLIRPGLAVPAVLSIALGVAVFLAIEIANRSSLESFQQAFAIVTGKADLEIRGIVPDELLPRVRECEGVAEASPLIESMATLPDFPGESVHLFGVDLFSLGGVSALDIGLGRQEQGDLSAWLGRDDGIAVTKSFLIRHHLKVGDNVLLQGPGKARKMSICFIIDSDDPALSAHGMVAAMDIAGAQEWVGTRGQLTSILVKLRDPRDQGNVIEKLAKIMPPGVTIDPPVRRSKEVAVMLAAFELNLKALSLISLLVGMFFVGNTAAAVVVRRRVEVGILRAMGAGKNLILIMVLMEAGLGGLIGSILGITLAPVLASLMAAPFEQTVTALYMPVDGVGGWPTPLEALSGFAAGMIATLVAAWIPGRQATLIDPSRVLHPGAAPEIFPVPIGRLALIGLGLLILAPVFSIGALYGGMAPLGFCAAFCILAGFSLMVPLVTEVVARRGRKLMAGQTFFGAPMVRLGFEQTKRSLHRIAPTAAALAAAVAMTVGISVMIHSFRGSVLSWVGRTLTADLFIAPAANELLGLVHTMPEGATDWWRRRKEVLSVGTYRETGCRTTGGIPVTLGVVSGPGTGAIDFLHGEVARKTFELARGDGVALSESMGRKLRLAAGGKVCLSTPKGPICLPIIDLYRDYTRDRGIILIGGETFSQIFGITGVNSLAIKFRPGTSDLEINQAERDFLQTFGGGTAFACYGNRALRDRILQIFNQTFAVTSALQGISIIMAVGGVILTMSIMVVERTREIGVLRSMGASLWQIVRMILTEAVMIALISCFTGLLSGAALALVLTWVINKAFFGWSIELTFPWFELLLLPVWMTMAALVAGAAPARLAAAIPPASALRME